MRRRTEDDLSLRAALRSLPDLDPPQAAWERLQSALDERELNAEAASPRSHARIRYALAASIAVLALFSATLFIATNPLRTPVGQSADVTPQRAEPNVSLALADLVAESARLERELTALPRYRGAMRVGTAGTIAGLEDQIAWIDTALTTNVAFDADTNYQEDLWRERVEVMNALVEVHYAQLPARMLRP